MHAPLCPVCDQPALLVDDVLVYRSSYGGRVWLCQTSGCDAYVGAHPDGRPKGTLAGPRLRAARQRAHEAFDGWWRRHGIARGKAYSLLAREMDRKAAHIGEMDEFECQWVVDQFRNRGGLQ